MAISAFQVTAAASWRRVRMVTQDLGGRRDLLRGGRRPLRSGLRGARGRPPSEPRPPAATSALHRHGAVGAAGGPGRGALADAREQRVGGLHEPALVLHAARAVAQVDVEAAAVGLAERAVEPVGDQPSARSHQPLPGSGASVRRSSLRAAASARAELLAPRCRAARRPLAAGGPASATSARARASSGSQRGQGGRDLADGRRRVDRPGGSGGHGAQRRALHGPDHNSPQPGGELRYGKPDQLSGELEGPWRTTPRTCSSTRSGWRTT